MFECRACITRCIRAVANDSVSLTARHSPLILTPRLSIRPQRRRLVTAAATASSTGGDALSALEASNGNVKSSKKGSVALTTNEKHLKAELAYLKDPAKLAQHVHYTLRQQKPDKALDLCRLASKSMNCVVAWNYVIDWLMKAKRSNEAIKIYNEMKKRGQFPDSYTYMQLLRGFPQSRDHNKDNEEVLDQHVAKAVSIYTSMTSPSSRVKPSIMHTNATLRVCSLARDMDALWTVASKIPEHGSGAADHRTYSILLGAIRYGAFGKGRDEHNEDVPVERIMELRQQAVNEGRRIWQEVIEKWRGGEILIDESLVVEMASLLIFGRRMEDWDDVLSLVLQTTNIERLIAPLGSPERHSSHVPLEEIDPQTTTAEDEEGWVPTPAAHAFKAVSPHKHDPENPKRPTRLAYVRPGNGILNVIMQACTQMRTPKTAYAYWEKLTNEYDVIPDRNNFKEMLRLLQFNRASNRAVEIIKFMHSKHGVVPHFSTYRMATAVLARDWKNTNVIDVALSLMQDMDEHLDFPDTEVLRSILSLIQQTNKSGTTSSEKALQALDRIHNAVHHLPPGADSSGDTVAVLKHMVSTIDVCLSRENVPPGDVEKLDNLRSTLNSHIGQAVNNRQTWRKASSDTNNTSSADRTGRKARPFVNGRTFGRKVLRKSHQLSNGEGGPRIRAHLSKDT